MKLSEYKKRIESVLVAKVPRKVGDKLKSWKHIANRQEKGAYEFVYRVPFGYSANDIEKQIDALYAACGAPIEIDDRAGAVIVRVLPEDFPHKIMFAPPMLDMAPDKDEILIGFDRQGEPLRHSLRVPHLLIAGKTGYGKTDIVRWILFQLIHKFPPEELELWIVDLKGFSFIPFKKVPHVTRIVRDLAGAKKLLEDSVKEMERRSTAVWSSGDRETTKGLKRLLVVIDEAYMISPKIVTGKESKILAKACDEAAAKISGTGREIKVGLLYCTQRPDADVINPLVKSNMDCKICFKTETESNSLIVLDRPDAARLPHGKPGRVLFSRDGLIEAQTPYIGDDDAWKEILKLYYKEDVINESQGQDIDTSEGNPPILDGTSGEVLLPQWEPVKTSERDAQESGGGKMDRGTPPGNRQDKALETILSWSFPAPSVPAATPVPKSKS